MFRSRAARSPTTRWNFNESIVGLMNPTTLPQIAKFAGGSLSSEGGTVLIYKISTDSRTLKRGQLFVALRGENFDGHNFVEAAAKIGAAGAIVESNWAGKVPENFALIRVKDTLQAYQTLAANYRKSLSLRDVAMITNIGVAHIEFMGSREAIAEEKGALVEAVSADGTVILNADDPFTKGIAARARTKVILAGTTDGTIRASEISQTENGTDFTILEGAHRCRAQ